MRLKFDLLLRAGALCLLLALFHPSWAWAQETPAVTNAAATTNLNVTVTAGTISLTIVNPGLTNLLAANLLGTNTPAAARSASTNFVKPFAGLNKKDLTFGLNHITALRETLIFDQPLWKYIASLIYIFLAFYVSKFLDYLTRIWLKTWAQKTATKFDDLVLDLLNGPVKIVSFVILLNIGLSVFDWPDMINHILAKGLIVIVAATLTYLALKIVDLLLGWWKMRVANDTDRTFNEQLYPIVNKSLKLFIIVVAVLVTSDNMGINITAAIASLSIGGLAIGLAAQDTLSNVFGAVAVFVDKPFHIGDRIRVDVVDGTVENIGLRSTRIRSLDGHLVTIPNKIMGNAIITNVTRQPNIKTELNIGLTYDTPAAKVKRAVQLLEEIFRAHPQTHDVRISFNKFNDSALNLSVVHWWDGKNAKAHVTDMQDLNFQIKERFDAEGLNFAFPTQTVYVKQDSPWQMSSGEKPPEKKA